MFSHITVGSNDVTRAIEFYDAVLATIGYERFLTFDGAAAYGKPDDNQFWVMTPFDGNRATAGNGNHVAFLAPSRDAVRDFHQTALRCGGSDEGKPDLRPHYHENYYGAYVRDRDGNKLQAVCHRAE
jgi:catechol 2,3-dioxygenase-like lactoylglutathione lyase family enzyme